MELQAVASKSLDEEGGGLSSYLMPVILSLFIGVIRYICVNSQFIRKMDVRNMNWLLISIYIISLFWSIIYPMPSLSLYILIILPLLLYIFMYISSFIISKSVFLVSVLILYLVVLLVYFQELANYLEFVEELNTSNNAVYSILYLCPLLLCVENKRIRWIVLITTGISIFFSFKRGGTIAFLLALFVYMCVENICTTNKKKYLQTILFVIVLGSLVVLCLKNGYFEELVIVERLSNIAEDEGSGRFDIYKKTIDMIEDSNVFSLFWGHGWNSVERDSSLKLSAHNDFLEVFYDFGLITFIIYILFYCFLFKRFIGMLKRKSKYASSMAFSFIIFIINSFVSHIIIYPAYMCLFSMCWGYILGMDYCNKNKFDLNIKQ